MKGSTCYWI